MVRTERVISYLSIGMVLLVGIVIVSGYAGFLEPMYRIGLGVIIIAYAGVRLVLLHSRDRTGGKKP